MIVVSDTSPISALLQIDRLDLLRKLYTTVTIPKEVKRELYLVPEQTEILDRLDWIITAEATDVILINTLRQRVDPGEAQAIALSVELKADALIIDERLGRQLAEEYSITIVGVLGVLVLAKKRGFVSKVAPEITKLQSIGFRISDQLIDYILALVKEL